MRYKYNVVLKRRLNVLSPRPEINKEEKFSFSSDSCNYSEGLLGIYYEIIGVLGALSNMSDYSNTPLGWTSVFLPELNSYVMVKSTGTSRKRFAKSKYFMQERKDGYIYEMSINILEGEDI